MRSEAASRRSPIYLLAASPRRVMVDATSLLVAGRGLPTRRYPLRLLSRVVCNERIDWSGEAISTCLGKGILIQWLDPARRAVGTARPRVREPDEVGALIEAALERRDWAARHSDWLRHERMRILRASGAGLDPALVAEAVHRDRLPEYLHAYARMACASAVGALLHQAGLQECYLAPDGGSLDLGNGLTRLVELELALHLKFPVEDGEAVLLATERWLDGDAARVPRLLGRLRRVASSWLEQ